MKNKAVSAEKQLFAGAERGEVAVLSYLFRERGVDPDLRDKYGKTALMEACRFGQLESVKLLVEAGADVNASDKEGTTVLMSGCRGESNREIVEYLITQGADVNRRDAYGCTPLMR